jgi:hypothetical protein
VPVPIELPFVGVNLHNEELVEVEHDPVYTEISPAEDIEGTKALVSSLRNGRSGEMLSRDRLDGDSVDDILKDTSWCVFEFCRKT